MTEISKDIKAIETGLKGARISLTRFYKEADIAHTTWARWKANNTSPTLTTWQRCRCAADRLLGASEQG